MMFFTISINSASRDSYSSSGNGSGPPGAPGGPKYGPPVPGTNYAAMGYSYDNGRDRGPPEDAPSRGGFGDRGGEGGSRFTLVRFEFLLIFFSFPGEPFATRSCSPC